MKLAATYLKAYLTELAATDDDRNRFLAGTGIKAEELFRSDAYFDITLALQLLRNIDKETSPGWHVDVASRLQVAHHGALGFATVTAPTVGAALDTLVRYESIRAQYALTAKQLTSANLTMKIIPVIDPEGPGALLVESSMIAFAGLVAEVLGRDAGKITIEFPAAYRPYEQRLIAVLPGETDTASTRYAISVPSSLLDQPCVLYDEKMHLASIQKCEELIRQFELPSALEGRIQQRIMTAMTRPPTLTALAAEEGVTERTLIRRLKENNTSYRKILSRVRRALAKDLLLTTELSVAEVSYRLGYNDTANFGRAFQGWFGQSPGQFRRR